MICFIAQARTVVVARQYSFAPSLGNTGHSHPSQAVQPMQTLTPKTFYQLRLRKLNPPSSNIVKYSFSLQPIMNNSFILQPIIFNPNFSSGQRKAPIFRRKACQLKSSLSNQMKSLMFQPALVCAHQVRLPINMCARSVYKQLIDSQLILHQLNNEQLIQTQLTHLLNRSKLVDPLLSLCCPSYRSYMFNKQQPCNSNSFKLS